jgi:exopolyphosphatase / guanosine-5'-triphosphate,3'-diphosphate pyrophosphatase
VHRPRLLEPEPERGRARAARAIGVIDIGSNTARLVAFETTSLGTVRAFYETKDAPRLGLDMGKDGRLTEEAAARGVATVRRFARVVRALGLPRTLAVATSAVRDATNGPEFVRQAERSTGVQLRIISGAEEARYAYLGVASAWELSNAIVCDLGGGSLQLAEVRQGALHN